MSIQLPEAGSSADDVLAQISDLQTNDVNWRDGRIFALVFHPDPAVQEVGLAAYTAMMDTNGLSPRAFGSLGQMEQEILQMAGSMMSLQNPRGSATAGGSESIFVAVKTSRDWARKYRASEGKLNMVLPRSAHPAFAKAAHCLEIEERRIPTDAAGASDPAAMKDAIDDQTALVVGSAPSYPLGVIDRLRDIGEVAAQKGVAFHIDACVGGFVLPFLKEATGIDVEFGFGLPGVTSLSMDAHKYGYAPKGSSIVLFGNDEIADCQEFAFDDWPGGMYKAPNVLGTRPGGNIASTWAVMKYLGREGYVDIVRRTMAVADAFREGIKAIDGAHLIDGGQMPLVAFQIDGVDVRALGAAMAKLGWYIGVQATPDSIHLTISLLHENRVEEFLTALRSAVDSVRTGSQTTKADAAYN